MCSQRPIAKKQVKQEKEVQTAQRLFREANERLQQAVKENNMEEMLVVSALMEVAQKKIDAGRPAILLFLLFQLPPNFRTFS